MDAFDDFLREKKFYPMLSERNALGSVLSGREFEKTWSLFDRLSEEAKDILTSSEMPERIERLQKEMNLNDVSTETVSAIIREYFLGRKDALWLGNTLMAKLDRKDVAFVKDYIQKNILTIKPVLNLPEKDDKTSAIQTVSLPLLDALSKYQRLSEQIVTEDRIAVKGESAPVRGSIRNWLRHYRDAVGIRKHSTMERGQFLFQGENTRRLVTAERERISFILKSLDEGFPVPIDTDRQEVVFPVIEEKENFVSGAASNAVAPALETSFRPLEKFPAQAAPIRKALEWGGKEGRENIRPEGSSESPTPFGIASQRSSPEAARSQVIGMPASIYAPVAPSATSEPSFSPQGNMSFSSSHVLPHEKAIAAAPSQGVPSSVQQGPPVSVPENSREPEAISVIQPYFGFHKGIGKEPTASPEGSSDSPRVVDLRSSGGRNARGRV